MLSCKYPLNFYRRFKENYDVMSLLILLLLVLVGSWLFSEVLVFLPLQLLHVLIPPHWLMITGALILLFWCFGD